MSTVVPIPAEALVVTAESGNTLVDTRMPVTITAQPSGVTVNPGSQITLEVAVSGTDPIVYQWRKNGVDIAGATGASLKMDSAQQIDEGTYTVLVSNVLGSVTSAPAAVMVNDPVSISVQPSGFAVNPGSPVELSVLVSGTGPFSYQWRRNGVAIPSASGAVLRIEASSEGDEGSYSVAVSNVVGTVFSGNAVVTVNDPVLIVTQPAGIAANPGSPIQLSVVVAGTGPFSFQWQRNGISIPNATGDTLNLPAVVEADEGNYSVVVTNIVGNVSSSVVPVAVNDPVLITSQPVGVTLNPGASITLAVGVSGTGPFVYEWRRGGVVIPEATNPTLLIASAMEMHEGVYTVVVRNVVGEVVSRNAIVSVNDPVTISSQPLGGTVGSGIAVTLNVVAEGSGPLAYQWLKNGVAISGATAASFSISAASEEDEGKYTVAVSNVVGTVISLEALIVVEDRISFRQSVVNGSRGFLEGTVAVELVRVGSGEGRVEARLFSPSGTDDSGIELPLNPVVVWETGDRNSKRMSLVVRRVGSQTAERPLRFLSVTGAGLGVITECLVRVEAREAGELGFPVAELEQTKIENSGLEVEIPVIRENGAVGAVSVEMAVFGGSLKSTDYAFPVSSKLEWAHGEGGEKRAVLLVKPGARLGAKGVFLKLRLRNPEGGAFLSNTDEITVSLLPATVSGQVSFSAKNYRAMKGSTGLTMVPISVVRTQGRNGKVVVKISPMGGTASGTEDYEWTAGSGELEWQDGEIGPRVFYIPVRSGASFVRSGETINLGMEVLSGGATKGAVSKATVRLFMEDEVGPKVSIVNPKSQAKVVGESVTMEGTATGLLGISSVRVALNNQAAVDAEVFDTGDGNTFTWSIRVNPEQGLNNVRVQAVDRGEKASQEVARNFFFSALRPELAGVYQGLLNPRVTASEIPPSNALLSQAFAASRGYGLLSLAVGQTGVVSGQVRVGGMLQSFKGELSKDGQVLFSGGKREWNLMRKEGRQSVNLGTLRVWVREGDPSVVIAELTSNSVLIADGFIQKRIFSAAKNLPEGMYRVPTSVLDPLREKGRYTAVLSKPSIRMVGVETILPQAGGWLRIDVSTAGDVKFVGRLADGHIVSFAGCLAPDLSVPMYVRLYGNTGFLAGIVFTGQTGEVGGEVKDMAAEGLKWFRSEGGEAPYQGGWPNGIETNLVGSKYIVPGQPSRSVPVPVNPYGVLGPNIPLNSVPGDSVPNEIEMRMELVVGAGNGGNYLMMFNGANALTLSIAEAAAAGIEGKLVQFRSQFSKSNGTFTGSFRDSATSVQYKFAGVVLQSEGEMHGVLESGSAISGRLRVAIPVSIQAEKR